MNTKEACKELNITRQGLYFMFDQNKKALAGHVAKDAKGRWTVDNEGVAILREVREKNKTVIVQPTSDKAIRETIEGMKIKIRDLQNEIRMLKEIQMQGNMLLTSVTDVVDTLQPSEAKRNLAQAARFYKANVAPAAVRKELKRQDRAKAKYERQKAREEKEMAQYDAVAEYARTGSKDKLSKYFSKKDLKDLH